MDLYYSSVLKKKKKEYLTEKQNPDGVLAIDLDFRFDDDIEERQHTEEDIKSIIDLYITNLNELVDLPDNLSIYVFSCR